MRMSKPLFLIGPPRSGTTIFTQVLNTSKKILITDELRAIGWFVKELSKIESGHEVYGDPYPYNYGKRFATYLKANGSHFIKQFYVNVSKEYNKENFSYWGDKYPHFDEYLDKVPRIFPRAKYIFIYRDLAEVINSVSIGHKWAHEKSSNYVIRIYENYINKLKFIDETQIIGFHFNELSDIELRRIKDIYRFLEIEISQDDILNIKKTLKLQSHSNRTGTDNSVDYKKTKMKISKKELDALYQNPKVIKLNDEIISRFGIGII